MQKLSDIFPKIGKKTKIFFFTILSILGLLNLCFIYFGLIQHKLLGLIILIVTYIVLTILAHKVNKLLYLAIFLLELSVMVWFLNISAKDKFAGVTFQDPWLKKPQIEISDNLIKIDNIRDFKYRTVEDYDINYISDTFDVNELSSLDFAISYWDGHTKIAHTMMIFRFQDEKSLVFSVETRIPAGEEQKLLSGIFKEYEQIIVLGSERDIIGVRVNYRGNEEVFIYKTVVADDNLKDFFLDLIKTADDLNYNPQFYNTLTRNCTTSYVPSIQSVNSSFTSNIKLLLNGLSDHYFYDLGHLYNPNNLTFEELKKSSHVKKDGEE